MFFGLIAVSSLTGCTPSPPPSADTRVWITPDAGVVAPAPAQVSRSGAGITHVTVEIFNPGQRDLAVNCLTDWFDDVGQPISSLMDAPQRVAVPAAQSAFCTTVSPAPTAQNFRISVVPTY